MAATHTRLLKIGELASLSGLSPDTMRHYERLGILACERRTPSGFRLYAPEALRRVRTIQAALSLGFKLREVALLLRARAGGKAPCRTARQLAGERLAEIERELERLLALRDALRCVVGQWDERLAEATDARPLFLLDSLADVRLPARKEDDDENASTLLGQERARAGLRVRRGLR